ncbi:uncharacterized protein LAESUDRAFT_718100 [Laetiporus sulphureus 93-53]|uniref:Uncharacterized protein n=1 Tax=Laetiporus sulphureus 93-53 TaxID=1314785 RepID=A0A165B8J9_9APHY|nr:uncharacterized protein LAESUDRAFT_718100 [Laetiporus sulphureus 93-53]KZT00492.1 hypothetical protein LAESUDRAFT_718100 [Laetiporus sulphureus 93-53]
MTTPSPLSPPTAAPSPVAVDTPTLDSSMTVTSDPALVAPSKTIVAPKVPPLETLASALFDRIQDLCSSHSFNAAARDTAGQQLLGSMVHPSFLSPAILAQRSCQHVLHETPEGPLCLEPFQKWDMELLSEGRKEALMQELAMADIVEEIVDGPPTSPESIPADDKMVDADEPQMDELEGENEVDPPSPKQVKPGTSFVIPRPLLCLTWVIIQHLRWPKPLRLKLLSTLTFTIAFTASAMSKSCYMTELEPICRKCGIPNLQDLKGWLPLHDFYELQGWPSPDEPSPEELHESRTAFRDYDEQIRALNKHGVGVKGAMEEQKAFREGRHVPRCIVLMHGKPPVLGELPAHGQLSFLVADAVVAPTVSSSTAGPSASTSIAFGLPEVEEVKPLTTKAGCGVKRSGSMEGELDAPPARRSHRALYNAQSKASSSGASVKKEVKEEVKEEVKSELEDIKPASSSHSMPARRATATPSAASASSNFVEFAGVMVNQDMLSDAIANLFRKK